MREIFGRFSIYFKYSAEAIEKLAEVWYRYGYRMTSQNDRNKGQEKI